MSSSWSGISLLPADYSFPAHASLTPDGSKGDDDPTITPILEGFGLRAQYTIDHQTRYALAVGSTYRPAAPSGTYGIATSLAVGAGGLRSKKIILRLDNGNSSPTYASHVTPVTLGPDFQSANMLAVYGGIRDRSSGTPASTSTVWLFGSWTLSVLPSWCTVVTSIRSDGITFGWLEVVFRGTSPPPRILGTFGSFSPSTQSGGAPKFFISGGLSPPVVAQPVDPAIPRLQQFIEASETGSSTETDTNIRSSYIQMATVITMLEQPDAGTDRIRTPSFLGLLQTPLNFGGSESVSRTSVNVYNQLVYPNTIQPSVPLDATRVLAFWNAWVSETSSSNGIFSIPNSEVRTLITDAVKAKTANPAPVPITFPIQTVSLDSFPVLTDSWITTDQTQLWTTNIIPPRSSVGGLAAASDTPKTIAVIGGGIEDGLLSFANGPRVTSMTPTTWNGIGGAIIRSGRGFVKSRGLKSDKVTREVMLHPVAQRYSSFDDLTRDTWLRVLMSGTTEWIPVSSEHPSLPFPAPRFFHSFVFWPPSPSSSTVRIGLLGGIYQDGTYAPYEEMLISPRSLRTWRATTVVRSPSAVATAAAVPPVAAASSSSVSPLQVVMQVALVGTILLWIIVVISSVGVRK